MILFVPAGTGFLFPLNERLTSTNAYTWLWFLHGPVQARFPETRTDHYTDPRFIARHPESHFRRLYPAAGGGRPVILRQWLTRTAHLPGSPDLGAGWWRLRR